MPHVATWEHGKHCAEIVRWVDQCSSVASSKIVSMVQYCCLNSAWSFSQHLAVNLSKNEASFEFLCSDERRVQHVSRTANMRTSKGMRAGRSTGVPQWLGNFSGSRCRTWQADHSVWEFLNQTSNIFKLFQTVWILKHPRQALCNRSA